MDATCAASKRPCEALVVFSSKEQNARAAETARTSSTSAAALARRSSPSVPGAVKATVAPSRASVVPDADHPTASVAARRRQSASRRLVSGGAATSARRDAPRTSRAPRGHPRGFARRRLASAPLLPEAVARERRRGETPRGSAPGVGGDTEERDAQPGSILERGRLELGGRVVTRGGIETCDGIERDAEFLRVRCGGSSRLRLQSCRLGSGRGDDCGDVGSIRESHPCLDGDDARRGRSRGMRDRRTRSRRVSRNIKTLGWFPRIPRIGNYRSHCRNFRSRRGYRSRHSAAREAATQRPRLPADVATAHRPLTRVPLPGVPLPAWHIRRH